MIGSRELRRSEARFVFRIVQNGCSTVEQARELIICTKSQAAEIARLISPADARETFRKRCEVLREFEKLLRTKNGKTNEAR